MTSSLILFWGSDDDDGEARRCEDAVEQAGRQGGKRRNRRHHASRQAGGKIVATEGPKAPIPLEELAAFRATMPRLRKPSVQLIREMREEEGRSSMFYFDTDRKSVVQGKRVDLGG